MSGLLGLLGAVAPNILTSIVTVGISPLIGLISGHKAGGSRTLNVVRSVQGASFWGVILPILYSSDLWFDILPDIQGFVSNNFGESLVGGGIAMVLSIVFEILRRMTNKPVAR